MKFFCLVNPVSGGKKGRILISRLKEEKDKGLFDGAIEETDHKALGTQLKRAYSYDRILIAGGDGTISNVICALEETAPPLGLLPLGTGNDLAKEIGVYGKFSFLNPASIIESYKTAGSKPLTVWKLSYGEEFRESLKFVNYISFGMDAGIVNSFAGMRKSPFFRPLSLLGIHGNRIGYFLAGIAHIFKRLDLKEMTLYKDGADFPILKKDCLSLIFANIKSLMGLGITNSVGSYFDEKLEVITTNNLLDYLSMILRLSGPLPKPSFITQGTDWVVSNLPEQTYLQVDGEGRNDIKSKSFKIGTAGKVSILTL